MSRYFLRRRWATTSTFVVLIMLFGVLAPAASAKPTPQQTIKDLRAQVAKLQKDLRAANAQIASLKRQVAAATTTTTTTESFTMPDLTGMDLQSAQDEIQQLSGDPLYFTRSEDATGQGRLQIIDRNWKVCSQSVAPGTRVQGHMDITFNVVKVDETCPTSTEPTTPTTATPTTTSTESFTMPDLIGMDLQSAQDEIQRLSGNSFYITRSEDATGQGRFQIIDRNWKVCRQNVAPGTRVVGYMDITFSVVKVNETCP